MKIIIITIIILFSFSISFKTNYNFKRVIKSDELKNKLKSNKGQFPSVCLDIKEAPRKITRLENIISSQIQSLTKISSNNKVSSHQKSIIVNNSAQQLESINIQNTKINSPNIMKKEFNQINNRNSNNIINPYIQGNANNIYLIPNTLNLTDNKFNPSGVPSKIREELRTTIVDVAIKNQLTSQDNPLRDGFSVNIENSITNKKDSHNGLGFKITSKNGFSILIREDDVRGSYLKRFINSFNDNSTNMVRFDKKPEKKEINHKLGKKIRTSEETILDINNSNIVNFNNYKGKININPHNISDD